MIATFEERRARFGLAFHLAPVAGDPLCGYPAADPAQGGALTLAEIEEGVRNQHAGWHYCSACLVAAREGRD